MVENSHRLIQIGKKLLVIFIFRITLKIVNIKTCKCVRSTKRDNQNDRWFVVDDPNGRSSVQLLGPFLYNNAEKWKLRWQSIYERDDIAILFTWYKLHIKSCHRQTTADLAFSNKNYNDLFIQIVVIKNNTIHNWWPWRNSLFVHSKFLFFYS